MHISFTYIFCLLSPLSIFTMSPFSQLLLFWSRWSLSLWRVWWAPATRYPCAITQYIVTVTQPESTTLRASVEWGLLRRKAVLASSRQRTSWTAWFWRSCWPWPAGLMAPRYLLAIWQPQDWPAPWYLTLCLLVIMWILPQATSWTIPTAAMPLIRTTTTACLMTTPTTMTSTTTMLARTWTSMMGDDVITETAPTHFVPILQPLTGNVWTFPLRCVSPSSWPP